MERARRTRSRYGTVADVIAYLDSAAGGDLEPTTARLYAKALELVLPQALGAR